MTSKLPAVWSFSASWPGQVSEVPQLRAHSRQQEALNIFLWLLARLFIQLWVAGCTRTNLGEFSHMGVRVGESKAALLPQPWNSLLKTLAFSGTKYVQLVCVDLTTDGWIAA